MTLLSIHAFVHLVILLIVQSSKTVAFVPSIGTPINRAAAILRSTTVVDVSDVEPQYDSDSNNSDGDNGYYSNTGGESTSAEAARDDLKRLLLQYGASYDRGFGASPSARAKVDELIAELESMNVSTNASRGIDGPNTSNNNESLSSPLTGSWRMVWTTAQDVLVLGVSPLATVGAIYQVFDPPVVTNIIDFIPRIQALLPPALSLSSLLRARVTTRASSRRGQPMRIGLDFEAVQLQPVELLGQPVEGTLPPLGFDLPRIDLSAFGADPENPPGYFDVTFLDEEMLVIRQNAPGGIFVLVKTDENTP